MKLQTAAVLVAATLLGLYALELLPERAMMKDAMMSFQDGFNDITDRAAVSSATNAYLNESDLQTVQEEEEAEKKIKKNSDIIIGEATTVLSSSNATRANITTSSNMTASQESPLNDQTVHWDASIHRPWLDPDSPNPPGMLLLTTYGWNQPNQTMGITLYRNFRTAELLNGIVNHPWFHPTAWDDINSGKMELSNETRYYVFLDSETCGKFQGAFELEHP
jgi:hypothetical protein